MLELGDSMKKKNLIIIIILLVIFSVLVTFNYYFKETPKEEKKEPVVVEKEKKIDYEKIINDLKNKYNNSDVVALVEIPNVLEEPIVQSTNNDFYLHFDIYRNENIIGATFLDYRNDIDSSNKLLIYSHSDPEGTLPFVKLNNYNNEEFFKNNKYIYLTDSNSKREYEVFSSYIETDDFDYVNLKRFNGLTYGEHLNKLKSKSYVQSDVELDDNSKVLILQTCSFNSDINAKDKFQLVMAKEIGNK